MLEDEEGDEKDNLYCLSIILVVNENIKKSLICIEIGFLLCFFILKVFIG